MFLYIKALILLENLIHQLTIKIGPAVKGKKNFLSKTENLAIESVQSVSDDEEYQLNSYKFGEQSVRMRQTSTHSISKREKEEIKTKKINC